MRKLMAAALAATAVVALGCKMGPAATPDKDAAGNPKTPACAEGCHDPKPVNPPHSPQPRDKQVRVRVVANIEHPVRPSRITVLIGKKRSDPVSFEGELFQQEYTVSPGTYIAIVVYNGKVGGHTVIGELHCSIYVLRGGRPEGPPRSMHHNLGDIRLPAGCEYTVKDTD